MDFKPPIAERETDELIEIASFPDNWNPLAVEQAKDELLARSISPEYQRKKFATLKRYKQKKVMVANKRKANESYDWIDFVFNLHYVLIEMLCDWDMKKDGYIRKHQQRKYTFTVIVLLVAIVYVLLKLEA
ncbi:hypothetical protein [Pontibacter rugosus]|uniref:DDE family transposase n=1 Tax=Pontibacter rugosus TaxID=1745966 RepID=A0ABW3SRW1_9BACT